MPKEFAEFGESLTSSSLFSSNILFWSQAGYFDAPSAFKPLLHTWSLSVEEQFYIFYPLLLPFLIARKKFLIPGILSLFVASFVISWITTVHDQSTAYYWFHNRAWELLIGAMLVIVPLPKIRSATVANIFSWIGGFLIAYSLFGYGLFGYSQQSLFPTPFAVVPTVGVALLIYAGFTHKPLLNRILSFRPIVLIGVISYSLYLWHWPVIVFLKYWNSVPLSLSQKILTLIATCFLSYVSWKYVEQPFRQDTKISRKKVLWAGFYSSLFLLLVGATIFNQSGFPSRMNPQVLEYTRSKILSPYTQNCRRNQKKDPTKLYLCKKGGTSKPSYLLWGDSHAQALAQGFNNIAQEKGKPGVLAAKSGCSPLLKVTRHGFKKSCSIFNDQVLEYVKKNDQIKTVFLHARWALSASGKRYQFESGPPVIIEDQLNETERKPANSVVFKRGLERTFQALRALGKQVILINQIPEVGVNVPNYLSKRVQRNFVIRDLRPTVRQYHQRQAISNPIIYELAAAYNITILEPIQVLCEQDSCSLEKKGKSLYKDDDHLSEFGATFIINQLWQSFQNEINPI